MTTPIIVHGCPVADGYAACWTYCGGGYPGTQVTTKALTRAVRSGKLDPKKLGCQPLEDRARAAVERMAEEHGQSQISE